MALRINRVHIRGLKAIKELNLPEDGFLWDGRIPDVVVIGGVNGSGKTTLLEFLWNVVRSLVYGPPNTDGPFPISLLGESSSVSLGVETTVSGQIEWSGADDDGTPSSYVARRIHGGTMCIVKRNSDPYKDEQRSALSRGLAGRSVLIPSDRSLTTFGDAISLNPENDRFSNDAVCVRWKPGDAPESSLQALLQQARWQDFNLEKAGRPAEATHEAALTAAFHAVTNGEKRIVWPDGGKLRVELKDGTTHTLDELSSGEKQMIIFSAHLRHLWKPGSLIFIDEPEAHLHDVWQTKLYEIICDWQQELGGQVWLATQSAHFFGLAEVGNTLILGGKILGVR
ncbi:MAG: AAA family ATPase [Planctomycetota bacterium]